MFVRLIAAVVSFFAPIPDLQSAVQFWQHKLSLTAWRIEVRVVLSNDVQDGTVGAIDTDAARKVAVIQVLDERCSDLPPRQARADQRVTIAHEMVHLSRLQAGDPNWQDEAVTVSRTYDLLRKNRR